MSLRNLTPQFELEIQKPYLRPFHLVFADFLNPGGSPDPVRVSTLPHDIQWDGHTWQGGISDLLEIGQVVETTGGEAESLPVTLDGIASDWFVPITESEFQGRTLELWIGAVDQNGNIVPDPYLLFRGSMDSDQIEDDGTHEFPLGETSKITQP